jgi:hypothetical protein
MDVQAQALIKEVWEVVDTNYLDARRWGRGMYILLALFCIIRMICTR